MFLLVVIPFLTLTTLSLPYLSFPYLSLPVATKITRGALKTLAFICTQTVRGALQEGGGPIGLCVPTVSKAVLWGGCALLSGASGVTERRLEGTTIHISTFLR